MAKVIIAADSNLAGFKNRRTGRYEHWDTSRGTLIMWILPTPLFVSASFEARAVD